jgi:hypothetical protein
VNPPHHALSADEAEAIIADALRANDRYVREVVEGFNVCPFARAARVSGRAVRAVSLIAHDDVDAVVAVIEGFEQRDETIEIVQLIFPRIGLDAPSFDAFVTRVRGARDKRAPKAPFALAAFHPDYRFNDATPDTLVAFFRKSPDPMIQLVRLSVIDALTRDAGTLMVTDEWIERLLRGEGPPPPSVSRRITLDNHARLAHHGYAAIAAIYTAIAADRVRR